MQRFIYLLVILAASSSSTEAQISDSLTLFTAQGHPMKYYLSLPKGWTDSREWPVVMILESADKEFKKNAQRYIDVRGTMPFILIAPINTDNGNQGRRDPKVFPYDERTWDYIEKVGDCQFNQEGIKQIMADVRKKFKGETKFYATGFEAGSHGVWSLLFNHPEYLKAIAPVAGNFRSRCVDENTIRETSFPQLPIRSFVGENDEAFGPTAQNYSQWVKARDLAVKAGYKNISETRVKDQGHVPFPKMVLEFFYSVEKP